MILERLLEDMSRERTNQMVAKLRVAVEEFVTTAEARGGYMPACATVLRMFADELADRYPDDTNGGMVLGDSTEPHQEQREIETNNGRQP